MRKAILKEEMNAYIIISISNAWQKIQFLTVGGQIELGNSKSQSDVTGREMLRIKSRYQKSLASFAFWNCLILVTLLHIRKFGLHYFSPGVTKMVGLTSQIYFS